MRKRIESKAPKEISSADSYWIYDDIARDDEKENAISSLTNLEDFRKRRVTKILVLDPYRKTNKGDK